MKDLTFQLPLRVCDNEQVVNDGDSSSEGEGNTSPLKFRQFKL